jgi:predicted aldo/keto reductase-like oxidoreductase
MSLPENQRKLEAVERLAVLADEAGVSLIELAIAFVVNHPAVTAAIVGPRTMEQLDGQLTAADITLAGPLLDRVDEVVRPGVNSIPQTRATANRCSRHTSAGDRPAPDRPRSVSAPTCDQGVTGPERTDRGWHTSS